MREARKVTPESAAATEAARRLWAHGLEDAASGDVAVAGARVCTQLRIDLERWVGVSGYRALLDRALDQARPQHLPLRKLACTGDAQEMVAAVRVHGEKKVAAGLVAMVAALIDLLGRVVGEAMAVQLVVQSWVPRQRASSEASEKESTHDG